MNDIVKFFGACVAMDMDTAGAAMLDPRGVDKAVLHAADCYLGYADKCMRMEQIIQRILNGETQFEVDDDITPHDLIEIEKEVRRRLNE